MTTSLSKPFVSHVRGNLKRGADVELGAKTLIVGPSLSGKTSILNCIELALCGGCSDVAGRAWVADKALLTSLAPPNTRPEAVATLSDGVPHTGGGFQQAAIFPIGALIEKLAGQSDTFRRDVLGPATAGRIDLAAVRKSLSTEAAATFDALRNPAMPALEALTTAAAEAKRHARTKKSEVEGAEQAIRTMTAQRPAAPTVDLGDLERQIPMLEASAVAERDATRAALDAYQGKVAEIRNGLDAWSRELANRRAALQTRTAELSAARRAGAPAAATLARIDAVSTIAGFLAEQGSSACAICANPLAPGQAATVVQRVTERRAQLAADPPEVVAAAAALEAARAAVAEAETNVAAYNRAIDAVPRPVASNAAQTALASAQASLEAAKMALARASEANAAEDEARILAVRDQISAAKQQIDAYSRFADEAISASKKLSDGVVASFLGAVQKRIAPHLGAFDLDLSGHVIRWGLRRGDVLHSALSGAETAMVATALAAAITEISSASYACRPILVPPDRQFDATTLGQFMAAVADVDAQVIILSTVKPRGRPSSAWTVIDLTPSGAPSHPPGKRDEDKADDVAAAAPAEAVEPPATPAPAVGSPLAPGAPTAPLLPFAPVARGPHAFASSADWPTAWAMVHGAAEATVREIRDADGASIVRHENGAVSKLDEAGAVVIAADYDGPVGAAWRSAA